MFEHANLKTLMNEVRTDHPKKIKKYNVWLEKSRKKIGADKTYYELKVIELRKTEFEKEGKIKKVFLWWVEIGIKKGPG